MAEHLFTAAEKEQIVSAIRSAEKATSGEIRVHIESKCKEDVMDHAAFIFDKLEMQQTAARNGVLFYLAMEDHKFAILGDAGINAKVPDGFWDGVRDTMIPHFKNGNFAQGLADGIHKAGDQLKTHFPYQSDDVNELSDEISFGKS